jgi:DNA-directed RNA polymerase subunit beta
MSDIKQISFAKLDQGMEMPHLLDIQTRAFEALLQLDAASHDREDIGLERVFKDLFPISDVHENFSLEFVRYSLGEPKYSVEECIERDMTYSAPLKATLQLVINEVVNEQKRPRNIIEKEVYLGELPLLTPLGTFVINGTRTASASSRRASSRSAARGSSSRSTSTTSCTSTSTRRRSSRPRRFCAPSATGRTRTFSASSSPFATST